MSKTEQSTEAYGQDLGPTVEGVEMPLSTGQSGGRMDRGGQGREDALGNRTGTGQAIVDEWLVLQGTVVAVNEVALTVELPDGEQVILERRPWRFALEQGLLAQVGDQITFVGFYDGGKFEIGQIEYFNGDQVIALRDDNGLPLWAEQGRHGE